MSRGLPGEEFDDRFEAFLRESISSEESLDSPISGKNLKTPEKQKAWFLEDDDDDDLEFGSGSQRFLKSERPQPVEHSTPVDSGKENSCLEDSGEKSELQNGQRNKRSDRSKRGKFESLGKTKGNRARPEASMSKDSLEDISEKSEEDSDYRNDRAKEARLLEIDEAEKTKSSIRPGADTLDEMLDKENFFRELEKNSSQPLDYGRMNLEMSDTVTHVATLLSSEVEHGVAKFSDDEVIKPVEEQDYSQQKPSMLSKVALLDSAESTLNTSTPAIAESAGHSAETLQDVDGGAEPSQQAMTKTDSAFMGTNTSRELEALHQAMREVNMSSTFHEPLKDGFTAEKLASLDDPGKRLQQNDDGKKITDELSKDVCSLYDTHQKNDVDASPLMNYHQDIGDSDHKPIVASKTDKLDEKQDKQLELVKKPGEGGVKDKKKLKFSHVRSSGYSQRPSSATSKRSRSVLRKPSPESSPGKHLAKKTSKDQLGGGDQRKEAHKSSLQPVQKDRILDPQQDSEAGSQDSPLGPQDLEKALRKELEGLQGQCQEERKQVVQLKGELVGQEQTFQNKMEMVKLEFEEQISKLKQKNFVLNSKISEETDMKKKLLGGDLSESISREQQAQLEKEMDEQERLLDGYQQENKRLYEQVKQLKHQNKVKEERMFKENQKILSQLNFVRKQSDQSEKQLYGDQGVLFSCLSQQENHIVNGEKNTTILGAGQIAQLESQLQQAKKDAEGFQSDVWLLEQTKVELKQQIDQLSREKEETRQKLDEKKLAKTEEFKMTEKKYEKEIERLNKKLRWYAENQQLLDKDLALIKEKDKSIQRLRARIDEFQTEAGKRLEENRLYAKKTTADAKHILDLERQVKEMEQILRKRYPNSLPALMIAAAAAGPASQSGDSPDLVRVLEKQVKKLQSELDLKDEDSDRMLRTLEQKYNTMKLQYEERIQDLENQLSRHRRRSDAGPREHERPYAHTAALEKEMESIRERHKKQQSGLQSQVDRLTLELDRVTIEASCLKDEVMSWKDRGGEFRAQVKVLQQELEYKTNTIQGLQKTVEKLRKEKPVRPVEATKSQKNKARAVSKVYDGKDLLPTVENCAIAKPQNDKQYEPSNFADVHISEVLEENKQLKMNMEEIQLSLDQQRVELRKSLAEAEADLRKSQEKYEEQIDSLRSYHQKELQKMLAEQALLQSTGKMAELQSKVDAQKVVIQHLQEHLAKAQVEAERASVLKVREVVLETQLKEIQDELRESRRFHTPEYRHFEVLQEKIKELEWKHRQREEELQKMIKNDSKLHSSDIEQEMIRWKKLVETKNKEIEKFRLQLDSILNVLRTLQHQGLLIPISGSMKL